MVRETQFAHQKSPAFLYGRMLGFNTLQQIISGVANAMNISYREDRTMQLQLQEVQVDEQGVDSTYGSDEPGSVYENDSKTQAHDENDNKVQSSKIEITRNLEHLKKTTSIRKRRAFCIGLIACFAICLLVVIPVVVCLNHTPGSVAPNNDDVDEDSIITKKIGDGVKVLLGNTANTYLTLLSPLADQEIRVCEETICGEGYKIDQAIRLIFVASNDKFGNYTLTGYDTQEILKAFQLQLEKPLIFVADQEPQKSGATFSIAPTVFVALVIAVFASINCLAY